MTPTEAVGFLSEAAWKRHTADCRSLTSVHPGRSVVQDESKCNCGAVQHNAKVKEALMTIGGAARRRK